jgi:hypothetical protein
MNNFAHLKPECPFYPLFAGGLVPILNILLPNSANCEGDGPPQDVYMVDLDKLSPEQWEAVACLVHSRCDPSTPLEIAKKEMRAHGLPLRAKYVSGVSTDVPFFL